MSDHADIHAYMVTLYDPRASADDGEGYDAGVVIALSPVDAMQHWIQLYNDSYGTNLDLGAITEVKLLSGNESIFVSQAARIWMQDNYF